ncbi:MAG: hypothetical protein K2W81_11440 [Sphingomonas sp.]|uniref:hypothetical protein n=1 Tax=Sphingomonas sp. TaxID=28214 RepID=UPI0025DF2212|nr:hypothetical protein [Sphingomonas sp.]MBY0284562.1 hypothetical protein [Sphingomonas sp.]
MNGGSRIIDLRIGSIDKPAAAMPDEGDDALLLEEAAPSAPLPLQAPDRVEFEDEAPPATVWRWLGPALALTAVVGWLGGMIALSWPSLSAGIAPLALVQFIAALCVPPVLIGILWLLAQRTSRTEARRFGATAQAMRAEARALDATLAAVSRRIEANGQQLAAQAEMLTATGDRAVDRLAATTSGIAQQVSHADAQARTLTDAVTAAERSLSVLLASLPRAQGETASIARTLEATGLEASERAAALGAQLAALAEQGRIADDVTGTAAQKLAAHITRMEATSETASVRLEQVTGAMSDAVDGLLGRTAGAVDEARKGIAAQGDAMLAMLEANQSALDRASRDSVEALAGRIATIEQVIDRIAARLGEQRTTSDALVRDLDHQFQVVEARVDDFHKRGIDRTQMLAASISALGGSADAMTEALNTGEATARKVINTSEDLLTSLDAAAREIDETLPEALARLDARIATSRSVVAGAKPELLSLVTAAESTHDAIEAIAGVIQGQRATLDQLSKLLNDALATGRERAEAIGETLDATIGRTQHFAEQAAPQLIEALIRVRDTAATAADRARDTLTSVIPEAATLIENASAEAMQRAMGDAIERQLGAIATAADDAVAAAQRASNRLADQMLTIAETTALVDARIEDAREEREKADTDGFGRRSSLLVEALNSSSIDIAKAFSTDVADSAWAAYLKGDRGVFTRRAVRLLDATEVREIARLHENDPAFREQVNRYIHDFESMLRGVLAQRDGAPISVTLLSSDMGKLYVALAQAIERLRS